MPRSRKPRLRAVTQTSQVQQAISHMSDSQLQCRDFGHSWRPYTAEWIPQRRHYLEALQCSRCRTQRLRVLGQRGELLGNRYVYSDGYLAVGVGRLDSDDRDAMRLASLEILLAQMKGSAKDAPKSASAQKKRQAG